MSQAQANAPTPSQEHSQTVANILSALNPLTIVGYLEGTSFLLLLGIAMPLKYMMGIPEGVKYIGMAHGVLFIAYIVMLMSTANKVKMPLWAMPLGVLGSFLPFGPFVFDSMLKKSLIKNHA